MRVKMTVKIEILKELEDKEASLDNKEKNDENPSARRIDRTEKK